MELPAECAVERHIQRQKVFLDHGMSWEVYAAFAIVLMDATKAVMSATRWWPKMVAACVRCARVSWG